MEPNDKVLFLFSIAFIVVMGALLVVPVLRRKSDVFTAWNFFLVGAIVFGGLSGFNCVNHQHYLPDYKASDYAMYYLGTVVFYTTITLTYHYVRWPRRMAGKSFLKWPELNTTTTPMIVLPLAATAAVQVLPFNVPVLTQILFQASLCAPVIGLAISFVAWSRSPTNVFLFLLVVVTLGAAVFAATSSGSSRRYLIGALAAAPIALYWTWLRYKPTAVIVGTIAGLLTLALPVLMGYTMVRHAIRNNSETSSQRFSQLIAELPNAVKEGGSLEGFMGQDSVEAAIMCIHLLNNGSGAVEVYPLYTPYWILVNPIPRSMWPDKPRSIGIGLVHASGLASQGMNFNIGLNVVGQCYYDGGLIIHFLYAVMFGSFLRFVDELLIRQPGNPFIIGALVGMSGQVIGWPRGGIEAMSLQIFMVCFVVTAVYWVGTIVLGGKVQYARTDHVVDYPVLRSPQDRQRWLQSLTGVVPTFQRRPVVHG